MGEIGHLMPPMVMPRGGIWMVRWEVVPVAGQPEHGRDPPLAFLKSSLRPQPGCCPGEWTSQNMLQYTNRPPSTPQSTKYVPRYASNQITKPQCGLLSQHHTSIETERVQNILRIDLSTTVSSSSKTFFNAFYNVKKLCILIDLLTL